MSNSSLEQRYQGLLLGLVVGDALGLPAEGLSAQRIHAWYPRRWQHGFIGRWGMGSDDSEHAWFVGQSLLAQGHDANAFAHRLAWCLRGWLLGLPAGVGLATLRSILKLWLGFSPRHSGVYSAGNGPAMRVAPIGALFANNAVQRQAFVRASTSLTHTDERAYTGALAIAETIAWVVRENLQTAPQPEPWCQHLRGLSETDQEWQELFNKFEHALQNKISVAEFAVTLGLQKGVTGYMYHTVPIALYAWYIHFGDFEQSLQAVLRCGGDTDTVGAITGALAGVATGIQGIPQDWLSAYIDWPRSTSKFLQLGSKLAKAHQKSPQLPVHYFWLALPVRNVLFLIIVLLHGVWRLLPRKVMQ